MQRNVKAGLTKAKCYIQTQLKEISVSVSEFKYFSRFRRHRRIFILESVKNVSFILLLSSQSDWRLAAFKAGLNVVEQRRIPSSTVSRVRASRQ
jgi:hypothetical protein